MTAHSDTKAERLLRLSEEVSRIAGSLAQLSMGLLSVTSEDAKAANSDELDVPEDLVSWLVRARQERSRYLSTELLVEPAWDMLLAIFWAEIAQRRVTQSNVCTASGVAPSTALRWLNRMAEQQLIVRRRDEHDAQRFYVELTPAVSTALRRYFVEIVQKRRTDEAQSDEHR